MVEGVQAGVNERKLCPICGETGIMQVFRASGEPTPRYRVKCGGCCHKCIMIWLPSVLHCTPAQRGTVRRKSPLR